MPTSLEAITTRYIDFYQVQDKYGQNYTQSYTILRIDENGILTDEIVSKEDLEKLCAANSELASRMKEQGIQTDILGNACFTTDKLSRFLKYGLDSDGNLYVYNYTGDRQLVGDEGLPESLTDMSAIDPLLQQYSVNYTKLHQEQMAYLEEESNTLWQQKDELADQKVIIISLYDEKIKSQEAKIDQLLDQIDDTKAAIATITANMSLYIINAQATHTLIDENVIQQYNLDIRNKQDELSSLQYRLELERATRIQLIDQQAAAIEPFENQIISLEQKLTEIPNIIAAKNNEKANLQRILDEYNTSSASDPQLVKQLMAYFQEALSSQLPLTLEELQNRKKTQEALIGDSNLEDLYARETVLKKQITDTNNTLSQIRNQISVLESLINAMEETGRLIDDAIKMKLQELYDRRTSLEESREACETELHDVEAEIANQEKLVKPLNDVNNQIKLVKQQLSLAEQVLDLYNRPSFFSAIDANYSIKWGNIEADGLSIMRLIMLITIARAESLEASLVSQIDSLATSSILLQNSASAMELILDNTVNYNTTFNGQKLGDFLKNDLKIAESISLPTTNWTQDEKDAVIQAIEDRQDALNVVSQETSINIQSLINKRDQSYLLGTNSVKLLYSGNLSVARNV